MQIPLQITFRNMEKSEAVEADIRRRVEKLAGLYDLIIGCRVVIEAPPLHKRKGGLFHTRVDVSVAGGEIVVNREPALNHAYTDAYVSIRDAFKAARRQVENFARQRQGQVKSHEPAAQGRISELYPMMDYGRIVTADGSDIYFHRNSLINADFDSLAIGTEVRFVEVEGNDGPQASTVQVVG